MNEPVKPIRTALLLASAALFFAAVTVHADEAERASRSTAGPASERVPDTRRDAMKLESNRPAGTRAIRPEGGASREGSALNSAERLAAVCCVFRVYSADTELFDDFDGDGYYTYLRVMFDVDTDFLAADVYANLYLALPDEPWELFFESEIFPVFGSSADDAYEVETEFISGYPPGDYDLLIDVFDAATDEFVASYGPADSSALGYLPIEDIDFDNEISSQVFISGSSGSSLSLMSLVLLAISIRRRIRNDRHSANITNS